MLRRTLHILVCTYNGTHSAIAVTYIRTYIIIINNVCHGIITKGTMHINMHVATYVYAYVCILCICTVHIDLQLVDCIVRN